MSRFLIFCALALALSPFAWADWQAGERLTFDVKFGFIKAGQAEFLYEPQAEGKFRFTVRAWTSRAVKTIFNVRDRVTTLGAHKPELPFATLEADRQLFENDYRAHKVMRFARPAGAASATVAYENLRDKTPPYTYTMPLQARDVFSALYALRAQTGGLQEGQFFKLPVAELDSAYNLELKVAGKEEISTMFGDKTTVWHIKPRLVRFGETSDHEGSWEFWVTADSNLTPVLFKVKMNLGGFTARLRDYGDLNSASKAPEGLPVAGAISPTTDPVERLANPFSYD